MSKTHLIKANKIFSREDRELLKSLNATLSLDVLILDNEHVLTNRRAFRKIKKDSTHKNLITGFAEKLKNQFGNGIKLRIVKTADCHDFILEKINFN